MQDLDLDKHTSWVFFAFSGGPHRWSSSANKFFLYKHERFGGFAKKKDCSKSWFFVPSLQHPQDFRPHNHVPRVWGQGFKANTYVFFRGRKETKLSDVASICTCTWAGAMCVCGGGWGWERWIFVHLLKIIPFLHEGRYWCASFFTNFLGIPQQKKLLLSHA